MLITLICTFCFLLPAQEKKLSIPVTNTTDPNSTFVQFPDLIMTPSNVVVFNEYSRETSHLYYYKDYRFVWKATAEKEYSKKRIVLGHNLGVYDFRPNALVASNSGSWVYHIELNPESIDKKNQYVTQFNQDGVSKKNTIEARSEFGKQVQTIFCDDQYLYYLATENGNELSKSKKAAEKLILNRFNAKDFSYKKIVLDLPEIEEGSNSVFWSFLGQTDAEKFLVSKNIDYRKEKYTLTIAGFNSEGKVTRTFTIEPKLDETFIRRANAIKSPISNFYQVAELDYHKEKANDTFDKVEHDEGSFSNIIFDPSAQSFYVFGLSGPKPYQKVGPINDGFYVIRYDLTGARTWLLQQPVPTALKEKGTFRVHNTPGYRNVYLQIMPDKRVVFHIQIKKDRYSWPISNDGKAGTHTVNDDTRDVGYPYEFVLTN